MDACDMRTIATWCTSYLSMVGLKVNFDASQLWIEVIKLTLSFIFTIISGMLIDKGRRYVRRKRQEKRDAKAFRIRMKKG